LKNTTSPQPSPLNEREQLDKEKILQKVLNTGIDSEQKTIKITNVGQACKKC
jgi:hypothetical protein